MRSRLPTVINSDPRKGWKEGDVGAPVWAARGEGASPGLHCGARLKGACRCRQGSPENGQGGAAVGELGHGGCKGGGAPVVRG